MELSEFEVRPCRSGAAFDVLPKKKTVFDLPSTCQRLKEAGIQVEAETPVVVMARVLGAPVSVYRNGKLQVRQTREKAAAEAIAAAVVRVLAPENGKPCH